MPYFCAVVNAFIRKNSAVGAVPSVPAYAAIYYPYRPDNLSVQYMLTACAGYSEEDDGLILNRAAVAVVR